MSVKWENAKKRIIGLQKQKLNKNWVYFRQILFIMYRLSGLLINQKMGSGRESCAAKATFAPRALQSR